MALAHFHFFSRTLGKQVAAEVLLPDKGEAPFATLYLLHGLSDDHTIWLRRSRVEMFAAKYPLMVVMPDGSRGFYTDNVEGPPYGRYLAEELVDTIDRYFPSNPHRDYRALAGLSMGGYGAVRTALAYPDRFCAAASLSGAVGAGNARYDRPHHRLDATELRRVFGAKPAGTEHDLVELARKVPKKKLPKLRLDCGTSDFLIEDNRAFHAKLTSLRVPHEYVEYPGSHDWWYWDAHIEEVLDFVAGVMRLS